MKSESAEIAQIFITSFRTFLKSFSYIISCDCPTWVSIKLSITEQISIRYTQKYLILYGKRENLEKIAQLSKELSKNSAVNREFLMEVGLCYDLPLNSFKISMA